MKNCPYCGSPGNFYFKISSRIYGKCSHCGLIYKEVQEAYDNVLARYCREDYFKRYSNYQIGGNRNKLFDHILDLLEKNCRIGSLLDVGTGCGFFLVAAQKRGWKGKGIEPSPQSVEVALNRGTLNVFGGTLREYQGNEQYDAVTFINVLEHSTEPWSEIKKSGEILRSRGVIYIRFPNGLVHSQVYCLASKFGLANFVKQFLVFHMYSFTPGYMMKLLLDHGFSEIFIRNSPPSDGDPDRLFYCKTFAQFVKKSIYLISKAIEIISCRKILVGTSLEVMAIKRVEPNYTAPRNA